MSYFHWYRIFVNALICDKDCLDSHMLANWWWINLKADKQILLTISTRSMLFLRQKACSHATLIFHGFSIGHHNTQITPLRAILCDSIIPNISCCSISIKHGFTYQNTFVIFQSGVHFDRLVCGLFTRIIEVAHANNEQVAKLQWEVLNG